MSIAESIILLSGFNELPVHRKNEKAFNFYPVEV